MTYTTHPNGNSDNARSLVEGLGAMNMNAPGVYDADEKLIIALDFGTTFSGIAYCFPNQRETKVSDILEWPGAEGESTPKIPTLINYNPNDKSRFEWGAAVNRMQDNVVGVKLLLDPKQERPLYLPTGNIKRDLKKLPKTPVEIAADFIRAIYRYALVEIEKQVPEDYLSLCQKQFVLSVPAVWSDAAKNATQQAAKLAGLFPVTMVKEPEAAALYTMHTLDFMLQVGDAFVVCDAGGGTVDLISYEVVSLEPRLELKELVPGKGGMAGSLGLNQRFVEAVKNLVGEDQFNELRQTKGFWLAEKSFDREVKKAFRGNDNEEFFVNFPMACLEDDIDSGLESNTWRMTGKDVAEIFGPLVTDILRLIDDQVKSVRIARPEHGIRGIFLVGGFGSSQYLKERVAAQYPDIQVLQPNDAWGAIAKGAALSKLPRQAKVVSTSATKHYGVLARSAEDFLLDRGQPTVRGRDGTMRVETLLWYVNIGDDIKRDQKISLPFFRSVDEDCPPSQLVFQDILFECSDRDAPRHKSKAHKIDVNCTLTSDLSAVDKGRFKRKIDYQGIPYLDISYDLVIRLESALMTFSLEVDGVKMGSVASKFD